MSQTSTIVTDGNSAPSFDTLEALNVNASEPVATKDAEPVETKVEKVEEKQPVIETAPKEVESATKEEKPEAVEAKEDAPEVPEENTAVKALKFKVGPRGKEIEIPLDAKVTLPINGKDEEFTIEELKQQVSGKVDWSRKYTELDKERQMFDADRKQTEQDLSSILTKAYQDKDPAGAILEMAQIANLDPGPLYQAFQEAVIGDLDKFLNMTELERENHLLKKERDFLSQSKKIAKEEVQKKDAETALDLELSKLRDSLGVKEESILKAQERIKASPEDFKEWLGGQEPTKKHFIQLADTLERWELADKILNKVDPELANDPDASRIVMDKLKGNKNINFDEAVALAAKFFNRNPAEKATVDHKKVIETKLAQAEKVSGEVPVESKKPSKKEDKLITWDDL